LLKMLLHPANFLLLDEPTNHLDMRAKDVLLEALMKYTGTVVFVSHDRYFIDRLATRVFEIGDGKVEIYPGNYEDYLWRKTRPPVDGSQAPVSSQLPVLSSQNELVEELADAQSRTSRQTESRVAANVPRLEPKPAATPTNGNLPKSQSAVDAQSRRLNPIKRKQMQQRLREVEEEITRMEAAVALCETQLLTFVSAEQTQRQTKELAAHKGELQSLMSEWEELSEELT
jgi:ATP-binding cassette, subfamily F, member 3